VLSESEPLLERELSERKFKNGRQEIRKKIDKGKFCRWKQVRGSNDFIIPQGGNGQARNKSETVWRPPPKLLQWINYFPTKRLSLVVLKTTLSFFYYNFGYL